MEPLAGLWDAAPGAPLQISYPNASRKWISPSPACQNNTEDMALRPKPEHGKNRFRQLANTRNTFHGCRTQSLRPNQLRLQSVRHSSNKQNNKHKTNSRHLAAFCYTVLSTLIAIR